MLSVDVVSQKPPIPSLEDIALQCKNVVRLVQRSFASLVQLAGMFMAFLGSIQKPGWEQVMLAEARDKSFGTLPRDGIWHVVKGYATEFFAIQGSSSQVAHVSRKGTLPYVCREK